MLSASIRLKSKIHAKLFLADLSKVLIASFCLSLLAAFKIPLYPTPLTLQTLGVFLIALSLRQSLAVMAILTYLVEASCGLPVLSGMKANPLWMIGPNAGFLLGFVPAAFVISSLASKVKNQSFVKTIGFIALGQIVIYTFGVLGLSLFFGLKQALLVGVVPFIYTIAIKNLLAATLSRGIFSLKKKQAVK